MKLFDPEYEYRYPTSERKRAFNIDYSAAGAKYKIENKSDVKQINR